MNALQSFRGTDRYTPVKLLGMGGMGAVYEVHDRTTDANVALKILLVNDAWNLLRFKKEFRVSAELHHRNLLRLYDLGQQNGQWFFTMELIRGRDLVDALESRKSAVPLAIGHAATKPAVPAVMLQTGNNDGSFAPPSVRTKPGPACDLEAFAAAIEQVLEGLAFLHEHGIVHRDLKPSNVMMDGAGRVRLLDFGLANRPEDGLSISEEGTIAGTLAYLSPERFRGDPGTAASDLYALGCMMYELLTGHLPFRGSLQQALLGRMESAPPRVDALVEGVDPVWVQTIARLMAPNPADRPTIAEVQVALGTKPAATESQTRPALKDSGEFFVGRVAEQHSLSEALNRARAGRTQLALVSGASGIGKSAFASVVLAQARAKGFLTFSGRAYEREQLAYVAFDRIMDAVGITLSRWDADKRSALKEPIKALERIFPTLSILTGTSAKDRAKATDIDPLELRTQCVESLQQLVLMCQVHSPLCFVFDDLQWADEDSFALLEALMQRNLGRVMILGLARTEALEDGQHLDHFVRKIAANRAFTQLTLKPLDRREAAQLVAGVTEQRFSQPVIETLTDQFEGNPFLVRRVAEHLASLGEQEQSARLQSLGSPEKLLSTILSQLSPPAKQLLSVAATAGSEISLSVLQRVSGLTADALENALGELSSRRVLRALPQVGAVAGQEDTDSGNHRVVDVYHDKIRSVVYDELSEGDRRALHKSIALALQVKSAPNAREIEALVRHWIAADEPQEYRKAALLAAEIAAEKLAFSHAAQLIEDALSKSASAQDSPIEPIELADRWERAAQLYSYAGHHEATIRTLEHARSACDLTAKSVSREEHHIRLLRLLGQLGATYLATGNLSDGLRVCSEGFALMGLPLERSLSARKATLAVLATKRAVVKLWNPTDAREKAKPDTHSLEQRWLAVQVEFFDRATRALQPMWPLMAAESALRGEILSQTTLNYRVLQQAMAFGAVTPVVIGKCSPNEVQKIHRELDQAEALATRHAIAFGHELVLMNRALLWLLTDSKRAKEASTMAREGFRAKGRGASYEGLMASTYHLLILFYRGDYEEALLEIEQALDAAHTTFVTRTFASIAKARILARWGRLEEATEIQEERFAAIEPMRWNRNSFAVWQAKAEILVAKGQYREALAFEEKVESETAADGTWLLGADRTIWTIAMLDARLGLLRRGSLRNELLREGEVLTPSERRKMTTQAEWVVKHGVFDFSCLGYRALALIAHFSGQKADSSGYCTKALSLSASNTNPYHRWLCLQAASVVRPLSGTENDELQQLIAVQKFVAPKDWQ